MKPKPWSKRWERPKFNIKGIRFDLYLTEEQMKEAQKWSQPWLEFDMMREYDTSKIEAAIWDEIEASKKSWSWEWIWLFAKDTLTQRIYLATNFISYERT